MYIFLQKSFFLLQPLQNSILSSSISALPTLELRRGSFQFKSVHLLKLLFPIHPSFSVDDLFCMTGFLVQPFIPKHSKGVVPGGTCFPLVLW